MKYLCFVVLSFVATAQAHALVSYKDEKGTRHFVNSPSEIPEKYRPKVADAPAEVPAKVETPTKPISAPAPAPAEVAPVSISPSPLPVVVPIEPSAELPIVPISKVPDPPPATPEERKAFEASANEPGESFSKSWAKILLAQIEAHEGMQKKLRNHTLEECRGKKDVTSCYAAWLDSHPATTCVDAVAYLAEAFTAAKIDVVSKAVPKDEYQLAIADNVLRVIERVDPKAFLILKVESHGMLDAGAKVIFRKKEESMLKETRDRSLANVKKILDFYEKTYLSKASEKNRKRHEELNQRKSEAEKKDLSF